MIGILFISIMMIFSMPFVNGDLAPGYSYSKSESLDYFIINNAYDDIASTCVEGDYIYILNATKLQKISLKTSLVEDEIEFSLLNSVTEFMRKGSRIYFDVDIDGADFIVCIDIESFTELARVLKAELTPQFYYGLRNVEYYLCNGHDFWTWGYNWAPNDYWNQYTFNLFKGRYDAGSVDYDWSFMLGYVKVQADVGNIYLKHYRYNASSDSVDFDQFNLGDIDQYCCYFTYAGCYFNDTLNDWTTTAYGKTKRGYYLRANPTGSLNLQHEYDEIWLDVAWGDYGVRDNPNVDAGVIPGAIGMGLISLDTNDRTVHYEYPVITTGTKPLRIARFDRDVGCMTYKTVYLLNNTSFREPDPTWGQMALARLKDANGDMRSWIAYVNNSALYPKAEYIIEVGGVDTREAGTIEFEGYDPKRTNVFTATKNIIAIFRNGTDTDNLYVCRNLIDRNLLDCGGYITPTLQFISANLYTVVGNTRVLNDGWLFMGEIYQLESIIQNMTYYYLELDDGENTLRFYYTNETKSLNITQSEQFLGGLIDGSVETLNASLEQHKCTWTFILNRNIVDTQNVSITHYGYNALEDSDISDVAITGLHIYNLGGLTYYEFVGDGGRTSQGTPFELYATNGSTSSRAKAEQIFRKLQSVHFLIELDMSNEWDEGNGEFDIDAGVGYVDIGIDYRLDGSWVDGFKIKLYVQDADVGHHDLGNDNNWIEWSVDFYNYDPNYDSVQNLQSQLIYSNHWGYENEDLSPDYHNRTSSQLWVDLWFDRTNASTTIAIQVNSYYRGMKEHGSAWWFGYGVFQPMISDYDNAKFLDNLYDENGEISNCQKIELVKFWIEVGKVNIADGNDETWTIRAIEDMNREQAIDRMMGVDEPTFSESKVLDMPQTGFVNAIKTAINNLSVTIWLGAFQFIKMLMASIGYLMNAIGLGVWWESFSIMLGNIATASLSFMDDLTIALFNSALLIEQITRLITNGVTRYVYVITAFITSILAWYEYIIQMFSGGGIFNINIWTSLNLEDIFILLMHLSPVWWINRLNESDHFIETLQGDLRFIIMIVTGLFNFLTSVIIVTMTLINILLGMLPI